MRANLSKGNMGDPGPENGQISPAKVSIQTKKLSSSLSSSTTTTTKTKPLFLNVDQSLAKMRRRKAADLKSNDILNPEIDLKKPSNAIYPDQQFKMTIKNLLSKLLISAFMLVFIFVVQVYTWITLPIYYFVQKPWIKRSKNDAKRVRIFEPSKDNSILTMVNTDSTSAKSPNEPLLSPIYEREDSRIYDFNAFKYSNLVDMFDHMTDVFNPNSPCIGYRQILSDEQMLDDNKNVRRIDGQRLRQLKLSDYVWQTYTEFFDNCKFIAQALMAKEMKKGDKLMIISETRYEWMTIFHASLRAGLKLVTVFPNLGFDGIINAIEESQIEVLVISTENVDLIRRILDKCNHSIKLIIYFDRLNQKIDPFANNIEVMSFSEIQKMGKEIRSHNNERPFPKIDSTDHIIIIYTSGTTGKPKAAMVSHEQFYSMLQALFVLVRHLVNDGPKNTYIAYLPMAHILELTLEVFFFLAGCRVGYSSPFTITDSAPGLAPGQKSDIKLLKPTIMTTVPLVLDRIIKETNEKLRARTPVSLPIFNYLIDYKSRWVRRGYQCNIVTKLLCPKVQEQFGGQLKYMICGGAPLNANVQAIIKSALDVNLIQGYGATETTGAVLCMDFDILDYGNVGAPLGEVKFRLRDWTEGGYSVLDKPNPRGEILIGGKIITLGYFSQPEMTKKSFYTDEHGIRWFQTGDIGEMYSNGTIKIIDRCKDLIKLQNGEYISLGKIEAVLKASSFVENACVYGGTFSNDLVALISPHRKALNELTSRLGKSHLTIEEICKDERIHNEIFEDISQVSKRLLLSKKETPKRIKLVPEVWSPDNDILTGALKLKRRVIETMYKQELYDLYNCKKFNIITTNGIDRNNNSV